MSIAIEENEAAVFLYLSSTVALTFFANNAIGLINVIKTQKESDSIDTLVSDFGWSFIAYSLDTGTSNEE